MRMQTGLAVFLAYLLVITVSGPVWGIEWKVGNPDSEALTKEIRDRIKPLYDDGYLVIYEGQVFFQELSPETDPPDYIVNRLPDETTVSIQVYQVESQQDSITLTAIVPDSTPSSPPNTDGTASAGDSNSEGAVALVSHSEPEPRNQMSTESQRHSSLRLGSVQAIRGSAQQLVDMLLSRNNFVVFGNRAHRPWRVSIDHARMLRELAMELQQLDFSHLPHWTQYVLFRPLTTEAGLSSWNYVLLNDREQHAIFLGNVQAHLHIPQQPEDITHESGFTILTVNNIRKKNARLLARQLTEAGHIVVFGTFVILPPGMQTSTDILYEVSMQLQNLDASLFQEEPWNDYLLYQEANETGQMTWWYQSLSFGQPPIQVPLVQHVPIASVPQPSYPVFQVEPLTNPGPLIQGIPAHITLPGIASPAVQNQIFQHLKSNRIVAYLGNIFNDNYHPIPTQFLQLLQQALVQSASQYGIALESPQTVWVLHSLPDSSGNLQYYFVPEAAETSELNTGLNTQGSFLSSSQQSVQAVAPQAVPALPFFTENPL